jgi:hypothetical protein
VPASVCLPAYNEASTVAATLAELSRLPSPDVDEIVGSYEADAPATPASGVGEFTPLVL